MAAETLIVGLGNPGRQYEKTRHNLGFMALMLLAKKSGVEFKKSRHAEAAVAEIKTEAAQALLVLPLTFMNNSGQAVRGIAHFDKIVPSKILVVCDDLNLPFGELRLKAEGSDGGHNGLRSIIQELGTQDFPRLKVGIGRPPAVVDQADFVLAEFLPREAKELPGVLDQVVECCTLWLNGETSRAMTEFNKRKGTKDNE